MNKFFRKNQKKMLAVATVFLMVVFVIQLAPQGQRSGGPVRTAGTLNGAKISMTDLVTYANEWKLLTQLQFVDPNDPEHNSGQLVIQLLGNDLANEIQKAAIQNKPLFFLLVQEARRQGIVATPEQFNTFINSYVRPLPDEGTQARDNINQAVLDCFEVHAMLDRMGSVIKISKPMQRFGLATDAQMLTLKFVGIPASHYLDSVAAPTQEQIAAQYDTFKDRLPGQAPGQNGANNDPLGFGYKVPDRVQLQYISINNSDLRDSAMASRSKEDWYIAAYGEFVKNRDTYDAQPVDSGAGATRPTTSPTTRRIENLQDDFALHASAVLDVLYDQATDDLRDKVLKDLNDKLTEGYGVFRDQQNAGGAAPATTQPGQYASYEFLATLADSLQRDFGVRASVANIQQLKTANQLSDLERIGKAYFALPGGRQPIAFPAYAVSLFQPFMSDAIKGTNIAALALAPWQSSNPLTDADRNAFIFRITGYDPAHTAPLADVNDKAIADYRLSIAYGKALAAAQKLSDAASKSGLDTAAISADWPTPTNTDPFVPAEIKSDEHAVISPLRLNPDSARALADQAQDLLSLPTSEGQKPQKVAPLPTDSMASVIELSSAIPAWRSTDETLYRARLIQDFTKEREGQLFAGLCSFDEVSRRLDYVPDSQGK